MRNHGVSLGGVIVTLVGIVAAIIVIAIFIFGWHSVKNVDMAMKQDNDQATVADASNNTDNDRPENTKTKGDSTEIIEIPGEVAAVNTKNTDDQYRDSAQEESRQAGIETSSNSGMIDDSSSVNTYENSETIHYSNTHSSEPGRTNQLPTTGQGDAFWVVFGLFLGTYATVYVWSTARTK